MRTFYRTTSRPFQPIRTRGTLSLSHLARVLIAATRGMHQQLARRTWKGRQIVHDPNRLRAMPDKPQHSTRSGCLRLPSLTTPAGTAATIQTTGDTNVRETKRQNRPRTEATGSA